MEQFSDNNVLRTIIASKKGGGVNAILGLLQDLILFQDKVESAIEAQDLRENKEKLVQLNENLNETYVSLLEIAKGGVRSMNSVRDEESEEKSKNPVLMNTNVIDEIP
jgi:hypothetical protein